MLTECFSVKNQILLEGRHVTGFFVRKQGVKVSPGLQEAGRQSENENESGERRAKHQKSSLNKILGLLQVFFIQTRRIMQGIHGGSLLKKFNAV